MTLRKPPALGILGGFVLFIVGNLFWIGPDSLATSSAEFAEAVGDIGNSYRRGILVNLLIIAPGYSLLYLSVAAVIRRKDTSVSWRRRWATAITATTALAIVMEVTISTLALIGVGAVDLDSPGPGELVGPPEWLINAMAVTGTLVFVGFALGALFCVVGLIVHGVASVAQRRRRVPSPSGSLG